MTLEVNDLQAACTAHLGTAIADARFELYIKKPNDTLQKMLWADYAGNINRVEKAFFTRYSQLSEGSGSAALEMYLHDLERTLTGNGTLPDIQLVLNPLYEQTNHRRPTKEKNAA